MSNKIEFENGSIIESIDTNSENTRSKRGQEQINDMKDYIEKQKEKHELFQETLNLKRKIYEKYPVGGALHIVLDDGNLKNSHIEWCISEINQLEEDKELFLKCANNLLKMTQTQRLKLYKA